MNRPRITAYGLHKTSEKADFTLLAGKVRIPPSPLVFQSCTVERFIVQIGWEKPLNGRVTEDRYQWSLP